MGDLFTPSHIVIVAVAALLLFGPNKLPELGRASGQMIREFKNGMNGLWSKDANEDEKKQD